MKQMIKIFCGLLILVGISHAQQPVRLVDRTATGIVLGAPGKPYNSTMTTITTGGTAITTAATKVKVIWCRNNSGSDTTLEVTDASGEVYVPVQTIATKAVLFVAGTDIGVTMTGVTITAGANSAVKCQVEGAQ